LRVGSEQGDADVVEVGLERLAVVVLVPDQDRLVLAGSCQQGAGGEDVGEHLAFVGLGSGQCPAEHQAVDGAHQVQPQPQKYREWDAQ
jgi:hypothetical protein